MGPQSCEVANSLHNERPATMLQIQTSQLLNFLAVLLTDLFPLGHAVSSPTCHRCFLSMEMPVSLSGDQNHYTCRLTQASRAYTLSSPQPSGYAAPFHPNEVAMHTYLSRQTLVGELEQLCPRPRISETRPFTQHY